jgi:predicted NBD/HSP70 family sugar kinase
VADQDFFGAATKGMASAELRLNNERAVLTAVAVGGDASAAEIARRTGLGPQSVSRILTDLEQSGLVLRGEARKGFRGQPAVPIHINRNGVFALGCEIGWRHYRILIRNLAGEVLGEHARAYDYPRAEHIFNEIASVSSVLANLVPQEHRDRILGIGVAVPTNIARNIGLMGAPEAEIAAWNGVDVAAAVTAATGFSAWAYNDGNAACWGQLVALPVPRPTNLAYFLIGTFVGAGLVSDGRLWEGARGNSANLGGMLVGDLGHKPTFVHLTASIYSFVERLTAAGIERPKGLAETWDWDALEPLTSEWLDDAASALALAAINTYAVTEFDQAIFDGAMPRPIAHRLVELVRYHLASLPVLTADHPPIGEGTLGGRAPALGAALMPMYRRFFSREAADTGLYARRA